MQFQQPESVQARAIEHQSELQPSAVGVGDAAGILHSRSEPAMPAMPHEIEGPQQQLELHRNSSGNSSNAVLAAERDPDAPSKGSMAALMQQAPNPAVVTAAARLVCQLPANVIESALHSLQGLPAGVATLAIAYCMCRRGSGGRQAGADPRLDPTVDAAQAERILENRRLAAFSKFKSRVAALAAEAASLGLLTGAAAAPAAAAAAATAGTGAAVAMPAPAAIAPASASGPALVAPLQAGGQRQHHTRAPQAGKPSAGAVLLAAFPKRSRPSGRGVKAGTKRGRPSAHALQAAAGGFSQRMRGGLRPLRNLVTKEEQFVLLPPPAGLTSPALPAAGLHTSALGAVLLCPASAAHAGMPRHGASGGGSSCNSPRLAGATEGPAAVQALGRLQQGHGSFAPAAAAGGASSQVPQQPWLAQASPRLPSFASSQEQLQVTDIVAHDIYTRTSQGGATGLRSGNSSDSMVSMVPAASGWHSPFGGDAAAAAGCGQSTAAAGSGWMGGQGAPPVPLSSLPPFCGSLSMLEGFDQVESLRELMGDDVFDLSML